MTNKMKIAVSAFVIVLIVLYGIIFIIPGVTGALKKTEIIDYGELKVLENIQFFIVRNENVYLSNKEGDINYYFEEGAHVRRGTKVMDIIPRNLEESKNQFEKIMENFDGNPEITNDFITKYNGIVSYYVDGYEYYFTPEKMRKLEYQEVSKLKIETINLTRKETLPKEPLFKLCDYSNWYIIGWVEKSNVSKFNTGAKATIEMPNGEVDVVIEDIIQDKDKWLIILKTDMYYEEFASIRSGQANLVAANDTGLIISNESITTDSEGNIGVYVRKKNGDFLFERIKVINTDGEKSAVEYSSFYDKEGNEVNTVEVYDEILKNAGS